MKADYSELNTKPDSHEGGMLISPGTASELFESVKECAEGSALWSENGSDRGA